jgi:hypothetical protein
MTLDSAGTTIASAYSASLKRVRLKPAPRYLREIITLIGLLLVVALAAGRVSTIFVRAPTDANEGWNAFQAVSAMSSHALYPPPDSLTGNNYPPLSFYIVGMFGRVIGDNIFAGRILALISVVATAMIIRASVRRLVKGAKFEANLAALVFLVYNTTFFIRYFAMNDPQWLAHAFMTTAVVLLIPREGDVAPNAGMIRWAVLLMLAGGMVKHNLIGFPLGVTLWLACYHPRRLGLWLGMAAFAVGGALLLCAWAYGPPFFADIMLQPRHYDWHRALTKSKILLALLPVIVLSLRLVRLRKLDNRLALPLCLLMASLPLGVLEQGGDGVDYNVLFEALIAACIGGFAALAHQTVRPNARRRLLVWGLAPFLVSPLFLSSSIALAGRADAGRDWRPMISRIRALRGTVACENEALCYWAGKHFEIDFFNYNQRLLAGQPATKLYQALRTRRYAGIQLNADAWSRKKPYALMRIIIERSYEPYFEDVGARELLRPRAARP